MEIGNRVGWQCFYGSIFFHATFSWFTMIVTDVEYSTQNMIVIIRITFLLLRNNCNAVFLVDIDVVHQVHIHTLFINIYILALMWTYISPNYFVLIRFFGNFRVTIDIALQRSTPVDWLPVFSSVFRSESSSKSNWNSWQFVRQEKNIRVRFRTSLPA